jgi:uncharacterized protein
MLPAPTLDARLAERIRPAARPAMFQRWEDLLFLHWKWPPDEIQQTLPASLTVDTHEGEAWLGVVPFFMQAVRPAWLPPVPWLSYFLELNVRTYVCDERGRPGVWFYSLDCNRTIPVWLARNFFHLPYEHTEMRATRVAGEVDYHARRAGAAGASHFAYRPSGPAGEAMPGSLEFFLIERYRLFAALPGGLIRSGRVHHQPYRISAATIDDWSTDLFALNGFPGPGRPPDHAAVSPGVSVEVYALGD